MKPIFSTLMCTCCAAILAGCAATSKKGDSEALLPEIDVVQVKENSEEALKLAQEAKLDVQMLNNKLSETDNRLIGVQEDMEGISPAKLEELENRQALLTEAFKDLYQKVAAIEVMPQIKITKPTNSKPAVFSPTDPSVIVTSTDYDMYQTSLQTFEAKNYDGARNSFMDIIAKFPDGDYADKSQYWIGESFYAQGQYAQAVAAFNKVLAYKETSKADDASLKLGLCYLRLGKNDLAVEQFKNLISRYPASEFVPRAQKYLNEIRE